jgi:Fe-Mn family superoxide dismutase
MPFELPPLPYPKNALEPHVSGKTMSFHHGKHHKAYVDTLNRLIEATPLAGKGLEDIIRATAKDAAKQKIFNNAAQTWNHTFFWNSMAPKGGGRPGGELAKRIEADFGGLDKFKEQFKTAATGRFGSGWAWLVLDGGALKVTSTANAETPIVSGQQPLLTCDVWEHAYYLDYQSRRADFVDAFLEHLVNWTFAAAQLEEHVRASAA